MKLRYANTAQDFIPYEVTFTITTREEGTWFHDNVAIKITDRHEQIGEAYARNNYNDLYRDGREFELTVRELKSDALFLELLDSLEACLYLLDDYSGTNEADDIIVRAQELVDRLT